MKTNPRHKQFAAEYLVDLNATQAAIRVGYSPKTAKQQGSRLLSVADVKALIEEGKAIKLAGTEITADRVLAELALCAFSSIDHYEVDDDGRVTLTAGAPRGAKRAISSVKRKRRSFTDANGNTVTEVDVELKFWDKPSTLRLAGRHVGLFIDARMLKDSDKDGDKPTEIHIHTGLPPSVDDEPVTDERGPSN